MLLINEVRKEIEQVQQNIIMSKIGIFNNFFLKNEEIDHFAINSLNIRYL